MTRHILVIDDDAPLLEVYQALLEEEGYQVTLSTTTFENASDVEQLHPDLILLDVWLGSRGPDMEDGLILLQRLRSYPPTSSLPVILCTAASFKSVRDHVEALREQGVPVIYKPFDMNELVQTIKDVFRDCGAT
jgi:DNA-binding response OmpR family regulator